MADYGIPRKGDPPGRLVDDDPFTQDHDDVADAGLSSFAARSDHVHGMPSAGGGGGAPDDVDYLVGTADVGLSAEIVVGTTPGGELAGGGSTWPSPVITSSHSGSAHHDQSHVLDGGDHTVSGLTIGHVLQALTATTFGFAAAPSGTPATTVTDETTFGIATAVGTDTEYARQDHTHGSPTDPVTAHAAAGDPHTGYVKESEFTAASDTLRGTGASALEAIKNDYAAAGDPDHDDDGVAGWSLGSVWQYQLAGAIGVKFELFDVTTGAANWFEGSKILKVSAGISANFAPGFIQQRSRGSVGSETIVTAGDRFGYIGAQGYDGNTWETGAYIDFRSPSGSTPADEDIAGEIIFATQVDGAGETTAQPAWTITHDKHLAPVVDSVSDFGTTTERIDTGYFDNIVAGTNIDLDGTLTGSGVPSGELGGTWDTITVDTTHGGSAHHAESHTLASHSARAHADLSDAPTDAHHTETHVADSTGPHSGSALTAGHALRASSATAFAFAEMQHGDLGGVGATDHHAAATTVVSETSHGQSTVVGTATTFAREDHSHGSPAASAIDWGEVGDIDAITFGQSAAAGVLDEAARADHAHAMVAESTISHDTIADVSVDDHHSETHEITTVGPHTLAGGTVGDVLRVSGATSAVFATLAHGDLSDAPTDAHHAEAHTVASTGPHAQSGLTAGHFLRASAAAAFDFAAIQDADVPSTHGGSAHHAESHAIASHSDWDWGDTADIDVIAFGQVAAGGASVEIARADHSHGMAADPVTAHVAAGDPHTGYLQESVISGLATPAIVLGTAAAAGTGTTPIRHNSTIVAFDATVPVTQAHSDAAATGSAAVAARRDHVHGMPAAGGHTQVHVLATGTALGADHTMSGAVAGEVLRALSATTAAFDALAHGDLSDAPTDAHHSEAHVSDSSGPHTGSGLTAGHVMRATSTTAFSFGQAQHDDLGGVGTDDHHAQSHAIGGGDHSGTLTLAGDVTGAHNANTVAATHSGSAHTNIPTQTGDLNMGGFDISGLVNVTANVDGAGDLGTLTNRFSELRLLDGDVNVYRVTDTPSGSPDLKVYKARAGVAAVADNDTLGKFTMYAHDGTGFLTAARITGYVDGAVATNDTPAEMVFGINLGGAAVTDILTLRPDAGGTFAVFEPSVTNRDTLGSVDKSFSDIYVHENIEIGPSVGLGNDADIDAKTRNNTASSQFSMERSRVDGGGGDIIVLDNDELGKVDFQGYDGATMEEAVRLTGRIDGTPTAANMPAEFVISTRATTTLIERWRVSPAGNIEPMADGTLHIGANGAHVDTLYVDQIGTAIDRVATIHALNVTGSTDLTLQSTGSVTVDGTSFIPADDNGTDNGSATASWANVWSDNVMPASDKGETGLGNISNVWHHAFIENIKNDGSIHFYPDSVGSYEVLLSTTGFIPRVTETLSLGTPALHFEALYVKPPVVNVYTANATWTRPTSPECAYIVVEVLGGGGGGGGTASTGSAQHAAAAGGGGAGYSREVITADALSSNGTVVVGGGGAGGTAGNNSGSAGVDSTFAATGVTTLRGVSGFGGNGSAAASTNTWNGGGAGGGGSGGDTVISGSSGGAAGVASGGRVVTGFGGKGAGPYGSSRSAPLGAGVVGNNYGSGGTGANSNASDAARAGGAGSDGYVVVTEFYA